MTTTIPAHIVAAAGCLPPVWLDDNGRYRMDEGHAFRTGDLVDLSDPQTAFGVALKLDAWERAGLACPPPAWALAVAARDDMLSEMADRIRRIAMDARIRRALLPDVPVIPGTLAGWSLCTPGRQPKPMPWRNERPRQSWWRWWVPGVNEHGPTMCLTEINLCPDVDFPQTSRGFDGGPAYLKFPALAGITDPAEALEAIHAEVCS